MLHPMHRYPLPWWLILDAQILRSATQFLRRNVTSFAIAYWAGGCHSFPDDDSSLAALAGIHLTTWTDCKTAVLQAFEIIRPQLDQAYAAEDAKHLSRVRRGQSCIAKVRAKKAERAAAARLPNPEHTLPRLDPIPPAHVITRRAGQKSSGKSTASLFTD